MLRPPLSRQIEAFFPTTPQASGLGRAMGRTLVAAPDGRIDLTPRPGAGTTFRVSLPVSGDARVW